MLSTVLCVILSVLNLHSCGCDFFFGWWNLILYRLFITGLFLWNAPTKWSKRVLFWLIHDVRTMILNYIQLQCPTPHSLIPITENCSHESGNNFNKYLISASTSLCVINSHVSSLFPKFCKLPSSCNNVCGMFYIPLVPHSQSFYDPCVVSVIVRVCAELILILLIFRFFVTILLVIPDPLSNQRQ